MLCLEQILTERDTRIAELEAFVRSIRHARQLIVDGFTSTGVTQIDESLRHLDREKPKS